MNDLKKDKSKSYLNPIFKVIGLFLILYIFIYIITFSLYYLGNNYDELSIKYDNFPLTLEIFTFLPSIIFIVFSIIYVIINKKEISFINKKENKLKNVILSLMLIYLVSFILDPFYHNFRINNVYTFKLETFFLNDLFLDILPFVIIPSIFEEIFFRSILINPFLKKKLFLLGVFITSILYSIGHFYIMNSHFRLDYLALVNYFFIGIVFSSLRIKYGLLYAILSHIFYNLLVLLYNNKIANLYLLDYIKSNYLYWGIYGFMVLTILYSVYRLLDLSVIQSKSQRVE